MDIVDSIAAFRSRLDADRAADRRVGFVPTMGYLHEGHQSLMHAAAADADVVAVSIFVNPLQFAADEDLASYPRDLDRDAELCRSAGVDVVLAPPVEEMYPDGAVATTVAVPALSGHMEGASRPTHFAGVATVVAKLFNLVGPCSAYFGEKDFQQLAIVRRMARDLSFPVEVVGCPIVREVDGLAMSSRNVYLEADEREAAVVLHRALQAGTAAVVAGEGSADAVRSLIADVVAAEPLAELDYAEVVDPVTLEPRHGELVPGEALRLLVAARLGRPRLLDNVGVVVPG
ncbi:MAG: pantoate--beta-alanine ligase [Acidimicrobiales bacterium]